VAAFRFLVFEARLRAAFSFRFLIAFLVADILMVRIGSSFRVVPTSSRKNLGRAVVLIIASRSTLKQTDLGRANSPASKVPTLISHQLGACDFRIGYSWTHNRKNHVHIESLRHVQEGEHLGGNNVDQRVRV